MKGPATPGGSSVVAMECSDSSTTSFSLDHVDQQKMEGVYRRISSFLMPTFVLVMVLNQVDRHNISYAALTMNRDLSFTAAIYGLGSALFFVTMCLCQVPSNIVLLRVGVPRWLGFLVFSWGVVATCCALIHDQTSFFILRLLLGAFESGAAPAMWYALSQFYPQERLTRPYMWLTSGILLSSVIGAPLAAGFLSMEGIAGLRGWQWLFLLEGIPSVMLGVALVFFLPESPTASKWLNEEQKELWSKDMLRSRRTSPPRHLLPTNPIKLIKPVLTNPLLPLPVIAGFAVAMASYAFMFFSAIIVAALLKGKNGLVNVKAAAAAGSMELKPVLLLVIPCLVAAVFAWAVATHSQKKNEVYWHSSILLALAGVMFIAFPPLGAVSVVAGFVAVTGFACFVAGANGPLLSVATRVCEGECNALGMAFYNSIATLGGFVGPYMTGYLLQRPNGLWIMCFSTGGFLVLSSGAIMLLRFIVLRRERKAAAAQNGAAGPKGLDSDAVGAAGAVAAGGAVGADVLGANKDIEAPRDLRKDSGPDMMYPPGKGHKQQGGGVGGRDALMHRGKDTNRDLLPTTQAR